VVKNKETAIRILKSAAISAGVALTVAFIQFASVLFIPLFSFWQFWASKVINVFYGQNLAHLLSYSNTWFAYYAVNPPTLRLFSVFPDSHSMAMFLILSVSVFLSLSVYFKARAKKIFFWIMAGLTLGVIILSGSRGAWVGFLPIVAIGLYLFGKNIEIALVKKVLYTFLIFGFLFLISTFYPPVLYKFQSWQGGENASTTFSFFERAKSISNLEETSNRGRMEIWETSAKSLLKYPLLGVGLGNYVKVLDEDVSAAKKGASAHNLYLDFASEIGIIGALILVAIFFEILRDSWLIFRNVSSPHFRTFGLFFGLYFLWVMAYSLFDVVLLNDKVLLFFMTTVGVLYSIKRIENISAKGN
jgi:putative inorganic carbon (HCO3(-)) transporter